MSRRQPVSTVAAAECDVGELGEVVATLPDGEVRRWARGEIDWGLVPNSCGFDDTQEVASQEAQKRQEREMFRRQAVRQEQPVRQRATVDVPVLGSVDARIGAIAAIAGATLLFSGDGDGGDGDGDGSTPDPSDFSDRESFMSECLQKNGGDMAEASKIWKER